MKIPEFAEQPELDPWVWLKNWLIEAEDEGEYEPTAMALSTLSEDCLLYTSDAADDP